MEVCGDAARITDERAGSEDQKHTSGGVFVAVDSNQGAAVGEEEGAVMSIQEMKEDLPRSGQMYVEGCECLQHLSGTRRDGPPRSVAFLEAVLKRARTTKHPWADNMSPERFRQKLLFSQKSNACNSTRRRVDVQIKKCQGSMGGEGV